MTHETGRDIAHPLPIAAVALLALNDHLLKTSGLLPGWLTGKLSDVAGLFFFPILLTTVGLWLTPVRLRRPRRRLLMVLSTLATGAVFAALKLSPALNAIASTWWGGVVLDPTDLIALPMLGLSLLFLEGRTSGPAPRWFQGLTVLAASVASVATSGPRLIRAYPHWEIAGNTEYTLACARARVFVARSGKQGVGVGVELQGQGCQVSATGSMQIGDRAHPAVEPASAQATLPYRYLYLAIPFDNEGDWNDGVRTATLELHLTSGAERLDLRLPMEHRFEGPYVDRDRDLAVPAPPASPGALAAPTAPAPRFATPPGGNGP